MSYILRAPPTMTYFPKEIISLIANYCGETYEQKRDRLWKSINPKIVRFDDESVEHMDILIVYDKIRGKTLEWCLELNCLKYGLNHTRPSIATDVDDWIIEYDNACWTTDNGIAEYGNRYV